MPGSGAGGRADLPAEHGFRFFPGFYRHLPDTMRRIPGAAEASPTTCHADAVLLAQAGGRNELFSAAARAGLARRPRR